MKRILWIGIICLCSWITLQAQTKVIAHRGYWKMEGSAQNSVAALRKAAEAGLYGSEFDVQLTADGVAVVNHDACIQGRRISLHKFEELKDLTLKNGEKLSTLDHYLQEAEQLKGLRLILEAKKQKTKERENQLARIIVECVKKYKLEDRVDYISFSMNLCQQFLLLAPDANIAYLEGDLSPKEVKAKGLNGIDYHHRVFRHHPEWIAEAHHLGMTVNSWTVNHSKTMKRLINLKIDFLTTNEPMRAVEIIREKERK